MQQLADLESRIRSSALPIPSREELLLELYYHQALCRRKLGRERAAAVTLAALWRSYPNTPWGRLAKSRLVVLE